MVSEDGGGEAVADEPSPKSRTLMAYRYAALEIFKLAHVYGAWTNRPWSSRRADRAVSIGVAPEPDRDPRSASRRDPLFLRFERSARAPLSASFIRKLLLCRFIKTKSRRRALVPYLLRLGGVSRNLHEAFGDVRPLTFYIRFNEQLESRMDLLPVRGA
jgi:hypothetical protein